MPEYVQTNNLRNQADVSKQEAVRMLKRVCYVQFVVNDRIIKTLNSPENTIYNGKQLNGIDIKFSVHFIGTAQMNYASIGICNLAKEDINFLTTWKRWNKIEASQERKLVRLFAGYEDDVSMIYEGFITQAVPTLPPDVWLNCVVLQNYDYKTEVQSIAIDEPMSQKDLFNQIANWLGLKLSWESKISEVANKIIPRISWSGTKWKLVEKLQEMSGTDVYIDSGRLVVSDRGERNIDYTLRETQAQIDMLSQDKVTLKDFPVGKTFSYNLKNIVAYKWEVSERNGMLGIPMRYPMGVTVRMLLNNKIRSGDAILLNSEKYSGANGIFYVNQIKHVGHLRGNDYYTEIQANVANFTAPIYKRKS